MSYYLLCFHLLLLICSRLYCQSGSSSLQSGSSTNSFSSLSSFAFAYNQTKCGLNYVQAGVLLGQRMAPVGLPYYGVAQPAPLDISGIPPGAVIEQAYIWWTVEGNLATGSVTLTNPAGITNSFSATLLGSDPFGKCWPAGATQGFRSDVTSAVTGNGTYYISGLPVEPTKYGAGDDADGATLYVIYSEPCSSYEGTLVIMDGLIVRQGGNASQYLTGFSVCPAFANARAFMIVSDFQNGGVSSISLNGGSFYPFTEDFWDYEEVPAILTAGQSYSIFGANSDIYDPPYDCYAWIVTGLYYQCPSNCGTPVANAGPDISICPGAGDTLQAFYNPVLSYQWSPSSYIDNNTLYNPFVDPLSTTTYYLTVTDPCGNTATDAVVVNVFPASEASFSVNRIPALKNGNMVFTNTSSGASSYFWDFGDGNTSGDASPTHTYTDTGYYLVTLIATSPDNCTDTMQYLLQVIQEGNVYMPNCFTPNKDGKNDLFLAVATGIEEVEFRVFNRWGESVYETKEVSEFLTKGWDGTRKGREVPVGVYTYYVKGKFSNGKDFFRSGSITLLK